MIGFEFFREIDIDFASVLRHEFFPPDPPADGRKTNIGLVHVGLESQVRAATSVS